MIDSTQRIPDILPWVEVTRFWSELDPDSQDALLDGAALLELDQRERIDVDFGLMLTGTAGLEYTIGDGRRCLAELFHSGDLIDMCREDRKPQGRIVALSACSVLALNAEDIEMQSHAHPEILLAYRHQVDDQLGRLRDHINDLAMKTPLERIASVLFELRRWPEATRDGATDIALPVLRKDIAAYVGMKPETVSRALRKLLTASIIGVGSSGREMISILDVPGLRRIANGNALDRGEG
ncbi:MAG: Crp/Fnr family transcriptional regulator [Pseudomonadota bacterium]